MIIRRLILSYTALFFLLVILLLGIVTVSCASPRSVCSRMGYEVPSEAFSNCLKDVYISNQDILFGS